MEEKKGGGRGSYFINIAFGSHICLRRGAGRAGAVRDWDLLMGVSMRRLLFAILVLALVPVALCAQSKKDDWENLKQLQTGHKIRVVEMDLKSWDGKLVSVSDEAITIREKRRQQEMTVERAKVFRVTDLQRSRRGRNALIGLAIGAPVGMAIGARAAKSDDPAVGGIIMMGFVGGIAAGVGALVPSHPTVYRSPISR